MQSWEKETSAADGIRRKKFPTVQIVRAAPFAIPTAHWAPNQLDYELDSVGAWERQPTSTTTTTTGNVEGSLLLRLLKLATTAFQRSKNGDGLLRKLNSSSNACPVNNHLRSCLPLVRLEKAGNFSWVARPPSSQLVTHNNGTPGTNRNCLPPRTE